MNGNRGQHRNKDLGGVPAGTSGTGGSYAEHRRDPATRDTLDDTERTPGPDAFGFDMDEDWRDIDRSTYDYRDLREGDLGAGDFSGQSMRGVLLGQRRFTGLNVRGSNLTGAHLDGGTFFDSDFRETDLTELTSVASMFDNCDMRAAVMDRTVLTARWSNTNLSSLVATNSDLHDTQMNRVNATDSSFAGVEFRSAHLTGVNFHGSKFTNSPTGRPCRFTSADMYRTEFTGVHFYGTDLTRTQIRESGFTAATVLSTNFDRASISGTSFKAAFLDDVSLRGARFDGCTFDGASISGQLDANTRFENCDLTSVTFTLTDNPDNRAAAARLEGATIDWI